MHEIKEPVIKVPKAIPTTWLCETPPGNAVLGGHVEGVVGGWVGTGEHVITGVTVTVTVVVIVMSDGEGVIADAGVGDMVW